MNCENFERDVLSAASGELPPREAGRLEAHLQACARCRAYREDVAALTSTARRALPGGEPSGATMAAIGRTAAEEAAARPTRLIRVNWLAARVLAYAAALAVALGIAGLWHRESHHVGIHEARISELSSVIHLVSGSGAAAPEMATAASETKLHALARELLALEGMAEEELAEEETPTVTPDPAAEPEATDLQSHSIPAPGLTGCV